MKQQIARIFSVVRQTIECWNADRAPQLAAALAFYTTFSLTPLVLIVIAMVGLGLGHDAARARVVHQIGELVGVEGAQLVESLIENASRPEAGTFAAVVGVITLLLGAAGVFGQIKSMLQIIWNVRPEPPPSTLASILKLLREQVISISMVLIVGFMMLVSLIAGAVLSATSTYISEQVSILASFGQIVNFAVSLLVTTLIFGGLFKYVPGARITWREVLPGALITAILFTLGRLLLGAYLGRSTLSSSYGAAGSLVILLSWVYYSAQILFFGAELTHVLSGKVKKANEAKMTAHQTVSTTQSQPIQ
ncbi:MAG: YihY/virulence factor BrkB family protein [Anaerolineae bacterium]|nr:YihY/virulence factor BrkB family protein [Anaerolineae bacterium]